MPAAPSNSTLIVYFLWAYLVATIVLSFVLLGVTFFAGLKLHFDNLWSYWLLLKTNWMIALLVVVGLPLLMATAGTRLKYLNRNTRT